MQPKVAWNRTVGESAMIKKCLEESVRTHDRHVEAAGHAIWLGSEPTFTDRESQAPEWLSEAAGEDKERRARQLLGLLRTRHPGAVVLRTIGRQYAGEPLPRWSYGLYCRRDGKSLWRGPPDWLEDRLAHPLTPTASAASLRDALSVELTKLGWSPAVVPGDDLTARIVFRCDSERPCDDPKEEEGLVRTSIHEQPIPDGGSVDRLAARGEHLVLLTRLRSTSSKDTVCVELPCFASVSPFLQFLEAIATAAIATKVEALTFCGFPPPVDATISWTTLTPDPAVLEVNHAPAPNMATYASWMRQLYDSAAEVGLSPYRLAYDGTVSDSGGGGQLTFGGPSPLQSPFFVTPALLPRLLRYLVRHPSLSYWLATHYVGGSSQSPRPDERTRDDFVELSVALDELSRVRFVTPDLLWGTLRHFLADNTGNPHRSELNIEKLYNPHLHGRGCLGLVEFRALAMPSTSEQAVAQALLLRSIIAMLMADDIAPQLTDWGYSLHDRFALPSELTLDLQSVFTDLTAHGWGLGAETEQLLTRSRDRLYGSMQLGQATLTVTQALEFWPLVGDSASQESGGSRLVDSSTHRIELRLTAPESNASEWTVRVNGYALPLQRQGTLLDAAHLGASALGVRFRAFSPLLGQHPTVPPISHIDLTLEHPSSARRRRARLHVWKPDGGAYDGLPGSLKHAQQRRSERLVVHEEEALPTEEPRNKDLPAKALSTYCLDLRRLPPANSERTKG